MNTLKIIEQKGYRKEDLSPDNQHALAWLEYLYADMENFEFQDGRINSAPDSVIGQLVAEIADDVKAQMILYMGIQIAEYQIAMAEGADV